MVQFRTDSDWSLIRLAEFQCPSKGIDALGGGLTNTTASGSLALCYFEIWAGTEFSKTQLTQVTTNIGNTQNRGRNRTKIIAGPTKASIVEGIKGGMEKEVMRLVLGWLGSGKDSLGSEKCHIGGFCWILQGFEEEGVALGGGAHQGRSGWSKITGATDL
ncbi:hypothetical protein PPACK8108_LOCUS19994 [Phakopsora pachyrhizi]|uniref:Uncharacterized protein n=1 Tax=Phakopsora pachyrhizi TaxID=170000 RepID=A0AAV0BFA0_PHAPC|nr:hypothetical protein PPACK8108_LOCUS19994 [Phakopsora pachyrhizi]